MKTKMKVILILFAIVFAGMVVPTYAHEAVGANSCPVSGDAIKGSGASYEYQGKTYQFCCKSCSKKFQKNPEKYLQKHPETEGEAHSHG